MSKIKFYKQCSLEKQQADSVVSTVAYIPEEFAVIGKIVKIKDSNDNWVDGWKVKSASEKVEASLVESRERDFKKTRKASDI